MEPSIKIIYFFDMLRFDLLFTEKLKARKPSKENAGFIVRHNMLKISQDTLHQGRET